MLSELKQSKGWRLAAGAIGWLVLITGLHLWLNFDYGRKQVFVMGYMPVITNMSAPLLDQVSKDNKDVYFKALKFSSFAEMASALRSDKIQAAFMIAPLSVVLRQQGVDVKVVYIGNRNESTLVARKSLHVRSFEDLGGKTVAVPMRFSGHNLSLLELMDKHGMQGRLNIVEMNPPDMASALVADSLDAYYVGEPFAATTLKSGAADLVLHVEDVWPNFICNLVIVKQGTIAKDPKLVRKFVRGAARASLWAKTHQDEAAEIAAKYWSQPPDAAKFALKSRKVVFDQFLPKKAELQHIADLMVKHGLIEQNNIDGLVDDQFAASVKIEDVQQLSDILK